MNSVQLTLPTKAATIATMRGAGRLRRCWLPALSMVGAMTASACVSVKAPDKPIVIELNINIKQEVIYRLADDARQNAEENAEIF